MITSFVRYPALSTTIGFILCLCAGVSGAWAAQTTSLVTLSTRPGVTQKFILIKPDQPVAAVILFTGGNGVLNLSQDASGNPVIGQGNNNFLVRTRQEFVNRGFMVAVVDAPSDHQGAAGMLGGFRASAEHAQDIGAVVNDLRPRAGMPVWLVGTSRGTESAANNAIRITQGVAGLALTSSVTVLNTSGPGVLSMNLGAIQVPTFVLHHDQDGCSSSPPGNAPNVLAALTAAAVKSLVYLTGGTPPAPGAGACDALTPHGFYGIESQAVDAIAGFIKSNPPLSPPSGITVQVAPNSVRLQFSPVTGATGYRVYYGASSGDYSGVIDLGNSTDKTINAPAGTYYGALTAYNGTGESGYSVEGQVVIPGAAAVAGK